MRKVLIFLLAAFVLLVLPGGAAALNFQPSLVSPISSHEDTNDFTSGDFNGDGFDDVAIATEHGIRIHLSSGDGNFGSNSLIATQEVWTTVVAGDFDDDGDLDLLGDQYLHVPPFSFYTFLNDGEGIFSAEPDHSFAIDPNYSPGYGSTAVGDVDGDDLPDVVIGTAGHRFTVALSNGDGTFTAGGPVDVPVTSGTATFHQFTNVAIGDYNSDGDQDVALSLQPQNPSDDESAGVYVANGDGTGNFTPDASNPRLADTITRAISTGRFNGDAIDDLLVSVDDWPNSTGETTSMLGGAAGLAANSDPDGTMQTGRTWGAAAADFTGEGNDDALSVSPDTNMHMGIGDGAGGFDPASGFPLAIPPVGGNYALPGKIIDSDVNGDGFPDILVSSSSSSPSVPKGVFVFLSEPSIQSSPSSLDFPLTIPGAASSSQAVSVNNDGAPTVDITSVTITGSDAGQFDLDSSAGCGSDVTYQEECEYGVTFEPTTGGDKSATLTIDLVGQETVEVALTGEADMGDATVTPEYLSFEPERINETSETQSFVVESVGDAPAVMGEAVLGGASANQYEIVEDDCSGQSIPVDETCEIAVALEPTTTGSKTASITIPFAESGFQGFLYGSGIDPGISVNPTSADFGAVLPALGSATRTFTVTSTGTTDLSLTPSLTGPDADLFYFEDINACHGDKAPTATCQYEVAYYPDPSTTGSVSATLSLDTNTSDDPVEIALTGSVSQSGISVDPVSSDFGPVRIGETGELPARNFTVTSDGTGPLLISEPEIEGDDSESFEVDTDCPYWTPEGYELIPTGDTCEVTVEFDPIAGDVGERNAELTFESSDPDSYLLNLDLTGTATDPGATVGPASLDFGQVTSGDVVLPKTVEISSTGRTALDVSGVSIVGPDASDFTLGGAACVKSLAVNATCEVTVTLDSAAAAGSKAATLVVETDDVDGPLEVPLSGTVASPPDPPDPPAAAKISLKLKSPGKVKRGKTLTLTATVKNTGGSAAGSIQLNTTVPGKMAKKPKAVKITGLAPGNSVTKKIKVKIKKTARKGKKLVIKVTPGFDGKTGVTVKRTVRVK